MSNGRNQIEFLESYRDYVETTLEPVRLRVKSILTEWNGLDYWDSYSSARLPTPSPVQRVRVRIKRPESAVDKILRKPQKYPKGLNPSSFRQMKDTLGARVIVYFISQLPLIDREIRTSGTFELDPENPPVAYLSEGLYKQLDLDHIDRKEKESGYASIHYVIRLAEFPGEGEENPFFELQLRTMAEDLWGEVEHILGYKPDKRTSFAVRKQFMIISRSLEALDEHFNFLFEELARFQQEGAFEESDPLNAENLPFILRSLGLGCAQKEVDGLLKVLFSRGIDTVARLHRVASPRSIEIIRNVYLQESGRQPINFEFVANLANLDGVLEDTEVADRVRAQREFLEYWSNFKRDHKA